MFLVNLLYRLYLLGAYLGFWQGQHLAPSDAALHLSHPVAGVALRQGRRFNMEDRVVLNMSSLPGGRFCPSANYTYAAVYDGHEGSAACDMLTQQLHSALYTAAAATWQSSCSIHHPRLQAAITHAAQKLNSAFLQRARQHVAAAQQADDAGNASSTTNSSSSSNSSSRDNAAAAAEPSWDGDDGSTAVFAMLVGRQLLVGNVGNSRAILCTSNASSVSAIAASSSQSRAAASRVNSSSKGSSVKSSSSSSSSSLACMARDAAASSGSQSKASKKASRSDAAAAAAGTSTDVMPYSADSGSDSGKRKQSGALLVRQQQQQQQQQGEAEGGTCSSQQTSETAAAAAVFDPPARPLLAASLTSDHTPSRADEADQIQQAGGQITVNPATPNGKLRVRGELEVTRSFGDLGFQDQGVVPNPEFVTHVLQTGDAFVVLASDGVFEALTSEEVCQHAWAVWAGSGTVQSALPPPPALALPGDVTTRLPDPAAAGIGRPGIADASGDRAAVERMQGCCDCTAQQQLLAAVGAEALDAGALLRRQRRQQHRREVALRRRQQQQQQEGDSAAVPDDEAARQTDGSVQLSQRKPQQQQQQQQLLLSEEQEAMVCQMGAAQGELDYHGRCGWEDKAREDQSEDEETQDLAADSAAAVVTDAADSSSSSSSSHTRDGTSSSAADAEAAEVIVDEHTVPDISYSYCPLPTGIVAPYTLPQAIAFRIVNEAYNRMSMDNLAVAVLDVREAAAAAAAARMRQQQQQQSRCVAPVSGASNSPAESKSKRQGVVVSSASSSRYGRDVDQQGEGKFAADFTGEELEVLEFLHLPRCELHVPEGKAAAAAAAVTAADAASMQDIRSQTTSTGSSSSSEMTALQRLLPDMQWGGGFGSVEPLSPGVAEGSAVMCGSSHYTTTNTAAAAADGPRQADTTHAAAGANGSGTGGEGANEVSGIHQYVLLQRMATAATAMPSHCHLHPVLGVDEVRLGDEEQQDAAAVDGGSSSEEQQQQQQHSLARHMQPESLLLQLRAPIASGSSAGTTTAAGGGGGGGAAAREQLCRLLLPAASQQQQQRALTGMQAAPQNALMRWLHGSKEVTSQYASSTGGSSSSSGSEGFMSACLAGAAAEPSTALVPGGGGLAAVLDLLLTVPRQQDWLPAADTDQQQQQQGEAEDAAGTTGDIPAGAAGGLSSTDIGIKGSDYRLVEPAWGRVTDADQDYTIAAVASAGDAGAAAGAASNISNSTRAPLLRAGLLLLFGKHHQRSLLGWHKSVQQSMGLQPTQQQQQLQASEGTPEADALQQAVPAAASAAVPARLVDTAAAAAAGTQLLLKTALHADLPTLHAEGAAGHYKLGKQFGRGHFGEVWSAVRVNASTTGRTAGSTSGSTTGSRAGSTAGITTGSTEGEGSTALTSDPSELLVLKRVSGSRGSAVRRSALREAYFGQLLAKQQQQLRAQQQQQQDAGVGTAGASAGAVNASLLLMQGHGHLVRYVEGFTTRPGGDVWLVFQNEGRSLHSLMYEPVLSTAAATGPREDSDGSEGDTTSDATDSRQQTPSSSGRKHKPDNADAGGSPAAADAAAAAGLSVVGPSRWWTAARASADSHAFVASLMQQLLQGLAAVQAANISHRDVKPENLLVRPVAAAAPAAAAAANNVPNTEQLSQQQASNHSSSSSSALPPDPLSLHLRLIDFGSALDPVSMASGLYGRPQATVAGGGGVEGGTGPSLDELTLEYAPPEVIFSSRYHHPLAAGPAQLHAYDMWSAGVVMLELVLGTPAVFAPSPATRAALDKQLRLRGRPSGERQLLYLLRGLMELCLYPGRVKLRHPAPSTAPADASTTDSSVGAAADNQQQQKQQQKQQKQQKQQDPQRASHAAGPSSSSSSSSSSNAVPIPWSCSDESLLQLVASRDPAGAGLEGGLALRLLQRLLAWDPAQRPTALQALQHAYFTVDRQHLRGDTEATAETEASDDSSSRGDEAGGQSADVGLRAGKLLSEQQQQQQQQHAGGRRRRQQGHVGAEKEPDAAAALQQRTARVRALLQQQAAALQGCGSIPVGERGWC